MAQNIALNVRTPQPNLAAITRAAQDANLMDYKLQNAPMQSELEALQMKDEIGERTALGGYREAAGKGDPNALDKLSGYPELQKEKYETFDGMSREEFMEAKKRSTAFRNAAQFVGWKIDGTPEQEQRWNASAKVLKDAGYINDAQFNQMIEGGPNDLMIQQAMTADEWLKAYTGKNAKDDKDPEMKALEIEKIRAEIERINRTSGDDGTADLKIKKLEAEIGKINAETDLKKTGDKKTTAAEMAEKGRNLRAARKEIGEFAAKAMEFATTPEEIAAAEASIRAKREEVMDFYGLTNEDTAAPAGPTGAAPAEEAAPASDPLQQARDAIAAGADPEAVKARLEENGIDASGL